MVFIVYVKTAEIRKKHKNFSFKDKRVYFK